MAFCKLIINSASRSDEAKNQLCLCLGWISESLHCMATKDQKRVVKELE